MARLERRPVHQKVVGSIPHQNVCGKQLVDVSHIDLLKKHNKNVSLGEDLKKRFIFCLYFIVHQYRHMTELSGIGSALAHVLSG